MNYIIEYKFFESKISNFFTFKDPKKIFITNIFKLNISEIMLHFRFKDHTKSEYEKSDTEDDLLKLIEENKISYTVCDFKYDCYELKQEDKDKAFESIVKLQCMMDLFIRGEVEYNKSVELSSRTRNSIESKYIDTLVDTTGMSKKLEILLMTLEDAGYNPNDIQIEQSISSNNKYWPYIRFVLKLGDNIKSKNVISSIINLIWCENIKLPKLSDTYKVPKGRWS